MSLPRLPKQSRFLFRVVSNGWFISIDEELLNDAARVPDASNPAYRRVKKCLGFSNPEMFRFLKGYNLYVRGYTAFSDAAYFCSFLS